MVVDGGGVVENWCAVQYYSVPCSTRCGVLRLPSLQGGPNLHLQNSLQYPVHIQKFSAPKCDLDEIVGFYYVFDNDIFPAAAAA